MTGTMDDLTTDGFQQWLDDMTSIDATGYGNDSTPIPQNNPIADYINSHSLDPNSLMLQQWILGKESGLQTRSAMGYEAVYLCSRVLESINLYNDLYSRQSDVEQRMTKTEGDFQAVIKNATVDSEVILARSSDTYGDYQTLDARLENDEKILAQFAPIGFRVTINHGLGIDPKPTVHAYQDAIGTETNGLGTAPTGLGETGIQTVPVLASYPDANTLVVDMPMNYKLNGTPQPALDGNYYLIDGNLTLKFDIGGLQKPKPNLLTGTSYMATAVTIPKNSFKSSNAKTVSVSSGQTYTYSIEIPSNNTVDLSAAMNLNSKGVFVRAVIGNVIKSGQSGITTITLTVPDGIDELLFAVSLTTVNPNSATTVYEACEKLELNSVRTAWVQ